MINETQKYIYNTFLRTSRSSNNKPFKYRKNFDSVDPTTELILKKLSSLFKSHPSLVVEEFFQAPYKLYKDQTFFDLQFFVTQRAIKCYTEYIKLRDSLKADDEEMVDNCKKTCIFLYNYCKDSNITLKEYREAKDGMLPLAITHLKTHRINFYTLHALDIKHLVDPTLIEVYDLMFENFSNTYHKTYSNFIKSTRLKVVLREALSIIEKKLLISEK
jgi:hypothetical protein